MVSPLLALLIKEVGQPVAQKMWGVLSSSEHSNQLSKAMDTAQKGVPVLQALQEAFGKTYFKIVNDAMSYGSNAFTFEAGTSDYISVNIEGKSDIEMLRLELNTNLERIIKGGSNTETLNYFKGVLKVWESRFINTFGGNEDERKAFDSIEKLLDGNKRTPKQIFHILSKTSAGTLGGLLIIQAVFLTMGVGVGIVTQISIFINGIPGGQIVSLAILGSILLASTAIQFKEKHVMTICVKLAYKLLDERKIH